MTLDQIYMLLTDREILKSQGVRTRSLSPSESNKLLADKDGFVKGRSADGTPMKAVIGGESVVKRLKREAKERKDQEQKKTRAGRRAVKNKRREERKHHGN